MSILPNLFAGLLVGLQPSTLTKYGASGPTQLIDLDFRTPATSWGSYTNFAHPTATDEWLMQSHTAGAFANNVGSATLDNDGGLTDQTAIGIYNGTDFVSHSCWEATAGDQTLECSSATPGDSNNADVAGCIVIEALGTATTNEIIAYKGSTGVASSVGWVVRVGPSGSVKFYISDGTNAAEVTSTAQNLFNGGKVFVKWWYDESADLIYIRTSGDSGTSTSSAAVTGSLTNVNEFMVNGRFAGANLGIEGKVQYSYVGLCVGGDAQTFYEDDSFWQHASDPTGLLTTIDRNCLISVPLSDSTVGHFAPDQLPIGQYGLFRNSAVTNLIDYSEDITQWTTIGSPTVASSPDGDDPSGFRNAYSVVATVANDAVARTFTTVAATEYTVGVMLKDAAGSGVTGRVIFYDETGGAELASQAFTASADFDGWVTVTATTNGGQVSSSLRVEVDTVSEGVYPTFAMAVEGSELGAYVRTNGSTASLVAADYGTSGNHIWSTKGSVRMECRVAKNNGGSVQALYSSNVLNANRRYVYGNANLALVQRVYDSAGVLEDDVGAGATLAVDTDYTLIHSWDESADGAETGGYEQTFRTNGSLQNGGASPWENSTGADNYDGIDIGHTAGANGMDIWFSRITTYDGVVEA